MNSKKGLSPVIASVLLILMVLVLAVLIFLWARGFLSEQIEKFGQPVESYCSGINFDAVLIGTAGSGNLEVVNRGNIDIFRLDLLLEKDGKEETKKFDYNIPRGGSESAPINLIMDNGYDLPDKVTAFPALVGEVIGKSTNKVYTCTDYGKVIL